MCSKWSTYILVLFLNLNWFILFLTQCFFKWKSTWKILSKTVNSVWGLFCLHVYILLFTYLYTFLLFLSEVLYFIFIMFVYQVSLLFYGTVILLTSVSIIWTKSWSLIAETDNPVHPISFYSSFLFFLLLLRIT